MDVLHAKVEQGKQNDDRLLLIPRDIVYHGQLVHIIETEHFLQLQCDEGERVGIVALSRIEHARNAADIAEILLDVLVLCAARRQDHRILRQCLSEVRIVLTRFHTAVAARHHDELLDRAAPHCLDDLVRHGKDLLMGKPADDLACLELRRGCALLRTLNHGCEILLAVHEGNMRAALNTDRRRRKEAILVAVLRRYNAVRRHEDRSVELLELLLLLPPRIAVVADEIVVLLELRIVVRGDHLAVRVDINARALRLLKEALEILEIMPRDENAGTAADAELHL